MVARSHKQDWRYFPPRRGGFSGAGFSGGLFSGGGSSGGAAAAEPPSSALLDIEEPRVNQTSMELSSEAADANAAAGFELLVERFYSGIKEEITAAALLLRRHYIRQQ